MRAGSQKKVKIFSRGKFLATALLHLHYNISCLSQGAKLFYLSGLIHGHYPKADVHNLARFISVMKFRPPDWRGSHPYIIADRLEDLTDPEELRQNPKVDRNISLYGFVRGTHLKPHSAVHIPGMRMRMIALAVNGVESISMPYISHKIVITFTATCTYM